MKNIFILLLLSVLFSCQKGRKIASEGNKIYLGEMSSYSSDLNCQLLEKEAAGKALKHCIKVDFYKASLVEKIKCPRPTPDGLLFGSFLLGLSPKSPLTFKFKCSKSYDDAIKELPDKIYFRNKTENFNTKNEFVLKEGIIWYRPKTTSSLWKPLPLHSELNTPISIGTDSEHFVAIDQTGRIFSIKENALSENISEKDWRKTWGSPLWMGQGMEIPLSTKSWEISFFSPTEDKFYVDKAGNRHGIGVGCTSLYLLSPDGQRLTYLDPWLPSDLSYEICTPARGRFISEKLSASGSTIFLINRYGDMYTRSYDFDISGGNDLILNYTYEYKKQAASSDKEPLFYEPLFTQRVLSTEGWEIQPKINGKITDNITIYKGSDKFRILRVEGEIGNGVTGYFEKGVTDPEWKFFATGKPLQGNVLFNSEKETSNMSLGPDESKKFTRKGQDLKMEILNFNPYCSPAELKVTFSSGKVIELNLHTRENIRQFPRERGLTSEPLPLNGAIEIPQNVLDNLASLGTEEREFILKFLKGKRFTNIFVSARNTDLLIYGQEGIIKNILDSAFLKPIGKVLPPISATFTWEFRED
jgi:hypothetical protein